MTGPFWWFRQNIVVKLQPGQLSGSKPTMHILMATVDAPSMFRARDQGHHLLDQSLAWFVLWLSMVGVLTLCR